ncbi:MAG: hypothetical protein KDD37_06745 [Bdellovibrionales bacterium]|nr:hypothetical protein [Bdellovibrionales bacterium]
MGKNPKKEENNVVAITRCCADGCTKRDTRANFCNEHFTWYKEGLITGEGHKAKDFDKKLQQYKARVA